MGQCCSSPAVVEPDIRAATSSDARHLEGTLLRLCIRRVPWMALQAPSVPDETHYWLACTCAVSSKCLRGFEQWQQQHPQQQVTGCANALLLN